MTTKQMSLARALVELKKASERIDHAIKTGTYVSYTIGKDTKQKTATNETVPELTAKILASYQKVSSLITNREQLKAKIVLSNATTQVKILGRSITVAEAIELKSTVQFRKNFLNQMVHQLTTVRNFAEKSNATLEAAIDKQLETLYGSEKAKIDEATLKSIGEVQRTQKELTALDPLNVMEKIEKLRGEIEDIESELNFVLSESNAQTTISVEL